jgi:hypothetical protein
MKTKIPIDPKTAAKLLRWAALGCMILAEKLDPQAPGKARK